MHTLQKVASENHLELVSLIRFGGGLVLGLVMVLVRVRVMG